MRRRDWLGRNERLRMGSAPILSALDVDVVGADPPNLLTALGIRIKRPGYLADDVFLIGREGIAVYERLNDLASVGQVGKDQPASQTLAGNDLLGLMVLPESGFSFPPVPGQQVRQQSFR